MLLWNVTSIQALVPHEKKAPRYSDVIRSAAASQITDVSILCTTVCSGGYQTKTSKLRVTGLCDGNPPMTGGFPSQNASHTENISIWWLYHDCKYWYSFMKAYCCLLVYFICKSLNDQGKTSQMALEIVRSEFVNTGCKEAVYRFKCPKYDGKSKLYFG